MEPPSDHDRRRMSRPRGRTRIAAALALVVVIAVILIVVLDSGSPSTPASSANAADVTGAATVQRRDLVETDTESGTLSYADPETVYNRLTGTITSLPNVGQLIKPGGTLFRVNGEPVTLMNGSTPAFRALAPSDTPGADVLQLNRNLVALGFNPDGIVVDDIWQAATTAGVDLFQASLGETETGTLALGQVVFMPGSQLISTVDLTLGSTGGGGGSNASNPSSSVSTTTDPPVPELVSLHTNGCPTSGAPAPSATCSGPSRSTGGHHSSKKRKRHSRPNGSSLAALVGVLRSETQALEQQLRAAQQGAHGSPSNRPTSHNPSSSGSHNNPSSGSSGGGGGSPVAILQTTSTKLVVTVDLSASSQSEAVVGEHVTVQMPSGNTVAARITAVSPVAQSSSNSGNNGGGGNGNGNGNGNGASSSSTVPITVTLKGHHTGPGLDQAAVSVNFAQQRANHVLSVPVTALVAVAGGKYAIQQAQAPHTLIPVTPGLFAAGYVQISGSGVYQGLQVTDSQG